ncbi:hypothetical protein HKX48_002270 [Thoreauomyces humboldtii]|nr:hypothetical protein HKX48_002270 [Thoreauomyces humboldtii]
MGHAARRKCCSFLFYAKATFALALSLGVMSGLSYNVYHMHKYPKLKPVARINSGNANAGPPVIDPTTGKPQPPAGCDVGNTNLGILEPTAGTMMGYSLTWLTGGGLPSDIKTRLGKTPAV